eukprot:gnl/TRDRNA2_/TRDRNA2_82923_c1_seq1.p1 gnl/TRDRNA2_/TRDRNA2_82923_c1~~gnl/TRDRNA2_/TRDRNA2_82923_c1_seq1.p1  ORF type:complete len:266 (+),score=22.55 gnl/TRDRNA2_/TRDRNA2_82923_c1_seq1:367-1164(+)
MGQEPNQAHSSRYVQCVFPFAYNGVIYNGCTMAEYTSAWCATAQAVDGMASVDRGSPDGWAICGPQCPESNGQGHGDSLNNFKHVECSNFNHSKEECVFMECEWVYSPLKRWGWCAEERPRIKHPPLNCCMQSCEVAFDAKGDFSDDVLKWKHRCQNHCILAAENFTACLNRCGAVERDCEDKAYEKLSEVVGVTSSADLLPLDTDRQREAEQEYLMLHSEMTFQFHSGKCVRANPHPVPCKLAVPRSEERSLMQRFMSFIYPRG